MPVRTILVLLLLPLMLACGGEGATSPSPTSSALQPFPPPIAGEYRLTLTASASCSLPADVRQRRYTARVVEPSRGMVTVDLSGAVFLPQLPPGFVGTRDGNRLQFTLSGPGRWVAELVDGAKEVIYSGYAVATVTDAGISGTYSGSIWVNLPGDLFAWVADCTATDHKIDFVRQ